MEHRQVNPWTWQDAIGFSQAVCVDRPQTLISVSGHTGVDEEGRVVHADDFDAEVHLLFANMRRTLEQAGGSLGDVFSLTVYLLDIRRNQRFNEIKREYLPHAPSQTTVGVAALAEPGVTVEAEAVAAV